MTNLSGQQLAGIEKISNWYANGAAGPFRLFGYAGTGKTTMAKEIPAALGLTDVRYGAYTGKAAHVLRTKGAPATTIHKAIYFPTSSAEAKARLEDAREELHASGPAVTELQARGDHEAAKIVLDRVAELQAQLPELEAAVKRLSFELNPESDWGRADLIILDEVSMVNAKLAADIESFDVPVLVLGDPAQLPPVEGGGYYVNAQPDHLLTEIHRQALENPITGLATRIRESTSASLGLTRDDMTPASVTTAMEHDQVLVWTNKRRWAMIDAIRGKLGRPYGEVVAGDRIMCLTNNKDLAVFNGQQFEVLAAEPSGADYRLTVLDRDNDAERIIPVIGDAFLGREMQDQAKNSGAGQRGGFMLATFANAITVHKAQGSEWPSVYVVNETDGMISMTARRQGSSQAISQARQWLYTAVTRAQDTVTITAPRPGR